MRVIRLHAPFDLRMHEEPVPQVKPDEVLIRVKSVGVCASDLHYYKEGRIGTNVVEKPLIIGHEPSGVIEEVSAEVVGLRKGDRVAIEPAKPCRECKFCRQGYTNVCKSVEFFGTPPIDGALREFVAWPARLAIPIPENVSFDEAAMVEPLSVGVYAVKVSDMKGGETIAILGAGAIGLSVLQAAKLKGADKIIVTEPVAERRQVALKLGAHTVIDPSQGNVIEQALAANGGNEPDIVFECAGEPETFAQAVEIARPLGTVVIVGIPSADEYSFPASPSRRKGLTIKLLRRSRGVTEESIEMVSRGLVNVASFATHTFPLEKTREAFELAAAKTDGVIRAVIHVDE
ncbi:MAG: NAD(P)-dependent alcohol dehydrogenase [Armatimonadota bacterium]|nr:NAD(P)-dependent alcohol dehydrogenase [Armatimonadota bacterium]